ncbi:hypothetical protein HK27_00320 [Acetobacter orientalis]|nr:hypothetical protein HK27_00320 [Acetobacter orientalis]
MCALKHSAQCWGTQAHAQGELTLQFGKYNMAHHAPPQMPRYLLCGALPLHSGLSRRMSCPADAFIPSAGRMLRPFSP